MTEAVQTSALDIASLAFAELRTLYGRGFEIEHGSEPDWHWRDAISGLTVTELERGLAVLAADRAGGVPNTLKLVACCKHGRRRVYPRMAPAIEPSARVSTSTANETLARIWARIGPRS